MSHLYLRRAGQSGTHPAALGCLSVCLFILVATPLRAAPLTGGDVPGYEDCLLEVLINADPDMTADEIRTRCAQSTVRLDSPRTVPEEHEPSALGARLRTERETEKLDYVMSPFKPTYILATYNADFNPDDSEFAMLDPKFSGFKKEELEFQVSLKMPLWRRMFGSDIDLYAAYSQLSFWQAFADSNDISAPFRETNYEPEIFLRHDGNLKLPFGGRLDVASLGFVHQSNGRSEPLSRSWNRIMGRVALDYGSLAIFGRLWWRIPEEADADDNPGMYRYLGYGDITAAWAPNRNTFTAMLRPGTEGSGFQFTWSYPISKRLRVYTQWNYGYGGSLIDYDNKVNRFGIGVAINDWLMRSF